MFTLNVQSKSLLTALNAVSGCIKSKNSIPIYGDAYLELKDETFFLTGSSEESRMTLPVDGLTLITGQFTTPIMIPQAKLRAYLSTIPDVKLKIAVADTEQILHITYVTERGDKVAEGKLDLPFYDADAYPLANIKTDELCHIVIPGADLNRIVKAAAPFAGNDLLRPVMNGVYVDVTYDHCNFVASDGRKMFKYSYSNGSDGTGSDFYRSIAEGNTRVGFILPAHLIAPLAAAFPGEEEEVDIVVEQKRVVFTSGEKRVNITLIEGRYPNYESVIPQKNPYHVDVNVKEMQAVLKRVSIMSNGETDVVELCADGMFLVVKTRDNDFNRSASDSVVIVDSNIKDGFRIGFRAAFLNLCLSTAATDTVRFQLADPSRAALISPADPNTHLVTMCMPVMLPW